MEVTSLIAYPTRALVIFHYVQVVDHYHLSDVSLTGCFLKFLTASHLYWAAHQLVGGVSRVIFRTSFLIQSAGQYTYCQSKARYSWSIFQKSIPASGCATQYNQDAFFVILRKDVHHCYYNYFLWSSKSTRSRGSLGDANVV